MTILKAESAVAETGALNSESAHSGRADDSAPAGKIIKFKEYTEAEKKEIERKTECLIFASDEPLEINKIKAIIEVERSVIKEAVENLKLKYEEESGLTLIEVAGGYQFTTKPEYAETVKNLFGRHKRQRLTIPSLEALAITAYKQPITRAELEAVRQTNCDGVLRTLLDRNFIKISGRKEVPGSPLLFSTTKYFLQYFGLKNLKDLPSLKELKKIMDIDIDKINLNGEAESAVNYAGPDLTKK